MTGGSGEASSLGPATHRPVASHWILVVVAVLALWNVLADRLPDIGRLPLAIAGIVTLVWIARLAGLDRHHLGLERRHLRSGLRLGAIAAGLVAVAVLSVTAFPPTRSLLADGRFVGMGTPRLAYEVVLRIPLAVAVAEEIAFRGVVLGMLDTRTSRLRAIWLSSALFGLWHVLPGISALETSSATDPGASVAVGIGLVTGQVVVTGLAGVAFAWLRLRGRHVVTPIMAHAMLNSTAFMAGWLAVQNGWT